MAEVAIYVLVISVLGLLDLGITSFLFTAGVAPWLAKSTASAIGLVFNFLARHYLVF
jgi:putative flippase GtrA